MTTKNIGFFCQLNLISKKGPNVKMRKNCKNLSNIDCFFLARFAHSAVYKLHISGAANRHAPDQYAKYVFFLSLSSHYDTNSLFHHSVSFS